MIKCPKCNADNSDDAIYCKTCNAQIKEVKMISSEEKPKEETNHPVLNQSQTNYTPSPIAPEEPIHRREPILSAVLSFLYLGLGQAYNGQRRKAYMFFAAPLSW